MTETSDSIESQMTQIKNKFLNFLASNVGKKLFYIIRFYLKDEDDFMKRNEMRISDDNVMIEEGTLKYFS